MPTYVVHLIAERDRTRPHKPPSKVIYEGDNADEAEEAARQAAKEAVNQGMWIRWYDFRLFGGGMKDTKI